MRLYHTGALTYNTPQPESEKNLGGLVASSPLANGTLNNLFGGISQSTLQNPKKEYRAVVLKNEGTLATDIQLYYTNNSSSPLATFKMALVALASDGCGGYEMESIPGVNSAPINAIFKNNLAAANALVIPSLPINAEIGIWIERSLNAKAIKDSQTCDDIMANYELADVNQVSEVNCLGNVADSLNGTYFTFDTVNERYYVWLDSNNGVDPLVEGREGVRVEINSTSGASTIAVKIKDQLNLLVDSQGDIVTTIAGDAVVMTSQLAGGYTAPTAGTSGFSPSITTAGVTGDIETVEDLEITISW